VTIKRSQFDEAFNESFSGEHRLFNKAELLAKHKNTVVTMDWEQQSRFIEAIHDLGQIKTKEKAVNEKISKIAWGLNDLINELKTMKL
jgi:hypothetical protein